MKKTFFQRFHKGEKVINMKCGERYRSRTRAWKGWKVIDQNLKECQKYAPGNKIDSAVSDILLSNPTFMKLVNG